MGAMTDSPAATALETVIVSCAYHDYATGQVRTATALTIDIDGPDCRATPSSCLRPSVSAVTLVSGRP
jgi:hypothetical protein